MPKKPALCPLCGSRPKILQSITGKTFYVICDECRIEAPKRRTKAVAVKTWEAAIERLLNSYELNG